jgi:hypothetical protein
MGQRGTVSQAESSLPPAAGRTLTPATLLRQRRRAQALWPSARRTTRRTRRRRPRPPTTRCGRTARRRRAAQRRPRCPPAQAATQAAPPARRARAPRRPRRRSPACRRRRCAGERAEIDLPQLWQAVLGACRCADMADRTAGSRPARTRQHALDAMPGGDRRPQAAMGTCMGVKSGARMCTRGRACAPLRCAGPVFACAYQVATSKHAGVPRQHTYRAMPSTLAGRDVGARGARSRF